MEPVPELHSLEEFRASPVPRLRLQESALYDPQIKARDAPVKPPNIRRSTEPTFQSPLSPAWLSSSPATPSIPFRPRNTSPFARGHFRSKSTASALAPPMSRAQSLPGVNGAGHLLMSPQRSSSPLGSPARVRIPRKPADEVFPGMPNRALIDISETDQIQSDEDNSNHTDRSASPILVGVPPNGSLARIRRPASPLRHLAPASPLTGGATPTTPSSSTSSPSYHTTRFNDSYLTTSSSVGSFNYSGSYTSSSVPSTPTSARSRSPSISSLETIPDTPDAEEAALEAERIAQLKAAADAADGGDDAKARGGLDASGGRGRVLGGFGSRDKRKRWSVCGAERRGDLNLDTIWED
jgi:hypothetical protein